MGHERGIESPADSLLRGAGLVDKIRGTRSVQSLAHTQSCAVTRVTLSVLRIVTPRPVLPQNPRTRVAYGHGPFGVGLAAGGGGFRLAAGRVERRRSPEDCR